MKSQKIIMYGRPGCLMVRPVSRVLNKAEAEFEYVDIWKDPEGRQVVQRINNGNESVPTLVFPDGSTLTEPGEFLLRQKLKSLGYDIEADETFWGQIKYSLGNPVVWIVGALLLFFILRVLEIL
ncbi:MAG: glutaredoxin domain-containing protein [Ardenticatenaceae bacterium]|nr:glutaredoxin domain-containing protein [Ardenticatenaceae bacterium]